MTDTTNAVLMTVADPFNAHKSRKLHRIQVGKTICEILNDNDYISMTATGIKRHGYFFVTVNGKGMKQAEWNTVVQDDDCLAVWTLPQGGGGGSNIGVILITVVMVAAAVFTGGATLGVALMWGAAAGAAVGLLTSLAGGAVPEQSPSNLGKDAASSTYTIGAQDNSARIGEAIPVQYGRMRIWPDLAAQPYTENRGNSMYVYQLMCLGQGKFEVETIQIEDSNISAYGEIQYEIIPPGQPVTLFPDNVITSAAVQGLEMLAPDEENYSPLGPYVSSPAGVKVNYLAFDIQLPQGAYTVDDDGNNLARTVEIEFTTQLINDSGVAIGPVFSVVKEALTFATKTPQMLSYKVEVPEGRYQSSGGRLTPKAPDNRTIDKVIWTALRAYAPSARTFGNVTMLATIIQGTNNLNSQTSRRINTIQTRMLPTWDPVNGWGPEVATSSPAWAFADALRNADYSTGWGTNKIAMSELYRLHQIWEARGDEFNGVYDTTGTLWQALTQIAMVGRATPVYYAGMIDIVRDEPKTIPAQIFTPGNILENTFKTSYKLGTIQTPDHVIVKFWNRQTWQEDQVTCVLPGSTTNVPATKELFGITDPDHAWREGMYAAAVNRDQRGRNTFTTEMEGLLIRYGDLIHVSHDVPGWGAPGKVISFNPITGKVVTTEPLEFTQAEVHFITFRKKNGKADGPWRVLPDPNAVAGINSAIVQGTAAQRQQIFISSGTVTDLTIYVFGPADREANKMVVLSAKPNSKGETQLMVCDYVTSTHIADQGGDVPIPPPISNLPGPPVGPIVNSVRVAATTTIGLQQIIADPAVGAAYYEFEGKVANGGNWAAFGVSGDPFLFVNLDSGPWQIRVRGVGSIPGPWATWIGEISASSLPLPKLSNFTATGELFSIKLFVEYEEESRSIAKTLQIWTGRTNVLGSATMLVQLPYPTSSYIHSGLKAGDQFYYWARVIDGAGRIGPWFNSAQPIVGVSSSDPDAILDMLVGQVNEEHLGQLLQAKIELIDTLQEQINALDGLKGYENKPYTKGQMVVEDGIIYLATADVPVNTPPPNTNYWKNVGELLETANGLAGQISTITAQITEINGAIVAQATANQSLKAAVRDNSEVGNGLADAIAGYNSMASAVTESQVRATEAEASARTIVQLRASIGQSIGQVSSLKEVVATNQQVTAQSIDQVNARIGTTEGQITNLNKVVVDNQTATTSSIQQISGRVGTAEGKIETQATVIADISGKVTTTWAVRFQQTAPGGVYKWAGIGGGIENGANGLLQSSFYIAADKFAFINETTNGLEIPFAIENGQTFIRDLFVKTATITDKLRATSIDSTAFTQFAAPVMSINFNAGEIFIRNKTVNNAYLTMRHDGLFMMANGIAVVELSTT